jgi:hypothetical protein
MSENEKGCSECRRIVDDPSIREGFTDEDTCVGCGCIYNSILDKLQAIPGLKDTPALAIIEAGLDGADVKHTLPIFHANGVGIETWYVSIPREDTPTEPCAECGEDELTAGEIWDEEAAEIAHHGLTGE